MNTLRGLHVLILGLGDSGLAMARWCNQHGARVTVWDSRDAPPQAPALAADVPLAQRLSGEIGAEQLVGIDLVLKSPGLAPSDARVAPVLQEARDSAIAVQGELDLFVRALADLKTDQGYAPQLLAITGTNGKTTTTAMTARLVERAGRRVATAGNIGPTLLDTLAAQLALDVAERAEVWVLELSSFQLEGGGSGVRGFEPSAGALLNITQDHLDWHGNLAAYTAAKARVFGVTPAAGVPASPGVAGAAGNATTWIVNRDDARVEALVPQPDAAQGRNKIKVSERIAPPTVLRFGLDAPRAPGDFGLVVENGMAWLVRALPTDDSFKKRSRPQGRRSATPAPQGESGVLGRPGDAWDEAPEIHLQRLMPADALRVRGRHNSANALAALALATSIGCALGPMLHGLREYEGEPHRLQFVAAVGDVEAFDDSKGTNVGATVAALQGLGADKAPARLVVILGGDGKGQDFSPLAEPLAVHARAVATLGKDAVAIEAALQTELKGMPLQRFASLPEAVTWCFEQARPGDAVLLSPACSSLDMFKNYAQRGNEFAAAVQALAAERGHA